MALDPDDPRAPYQQVAAALRAKILTGEYQPGEQLPSGHELAASFGVARMTVQQALRLLRDEKLIVSRQGSGVFVRQQTARVVSPAYHVEQAFDQQLVSIEFAGFSAETLAANLAEPLDRIKTGRQAPQAISIRVLVPDHSIPAAIPCRASDGADIPHVREQIGRVSDEHLAHLSDTVFDMARLGLLGQVTMQVRSHRLTPAFELLVLNQRTAIFRYYHVKKRSSRLDGERITYYTLEHGNAPSLAYEGSSPETASPEVHVARHWFDDVWRTVSRPRSLPPLPRTGG